MTAPIVNESRKEFFPDKDKIAERITEQEMTPDLYDYLIGPDVAKILHLYQQVCKNKGSLDDGDEHFFTCDIFRIDFPESAEELDTAEDSYLKRITPGAKCGSPDW